MSVVVPTRSLNFSVKGLLAVPTNKLDIVPTPSYCTHMLTTTYKLRVGDPELAKWKLEATEAGQTLSAWIREKCNNGQTPTFPIKLDAVASLKSGVGKVSFETQVPGRCHCGHPTEEHHHGRSCQHKGCYCREFVVE